MNAWLAATVACSRSCGGTAVSALCVAPEDTASEKLAGALGSSSPSFESIRAWKIAPSAAVPVAIPTWRKVLLMPEAIPARAAATTPSATEAIPGLVMPTPIPVRMNPGSSVVQPLSRLIPDISARPTPTRIIPLPMSARAGTRFSARPAIGATTNESTVKGRKRKPAWSGEYSSTSWM